MPYQYKTHWLETERSVMAACGASSSVHRYAFSSEGVNCKLCLKRFQKLNKRKDDQKLLSCPSEEQEYCTE